MFKYKYYYNNIKEILRFFIPKNQRVLYYGIHPDMLEAVAPSYGVMVDCDHLDTIPNEQFDYIILDFSLGRTEDICGLLKSALLHSYPYSRFIIHQHNYLWEWILTLAGYLGLKEKEQTRNWLSLEDINI